MGALHYMAQAGSRNYLEWKTLKANPIANCTVKMSTFGESDFKVLMPSDGSADFEGWFPCGRQPGFEGKEFRLPSSLTCTNCVLQFV